MIQQIGQVAIYTESGRLNKLFAIAGGDLLIGNLSSIALAGGGTALFLSTSKPQWAANRTSVYFVDGTNTVVRLNPATASIEAYAPSGLPAAPKFCCFWRERLVLSDGVHFYASRLGDPDDWNYAAADAARAFAGNTSQSGRTSDIHTALIPMRDDVLIIGGDHTIWRLRGDPAAGGSLDLLSPSIGILGPDAWCQDPAGNVYFLGAGGLYLLGVDGSIQNLSRDKLNSYFVKIDRKTNWLELEYDRDRHGVWVFVTPKTDGAAVHLFYDTRLGGFWPQQFPVDHGPVCACVYDGDGPNDRLLLLGGRSGYVHKLTAAALSDTGVPISSFVHCGPVTPAGDSGTAKMLRMDAILGERPSGVGTNEWNLNYQVRVGDDPQTAIASPTQTRGGQWNTPGEQEGQPTRIGGNTFVLSLSNAEKNKTWSVDRISGVFLPGGRQR